LGLQLVVEAALREGGVRALTWAAAPESTLVAPFARLGLPAAQLAAGQADGIGACIPALARLCTSPLLPFDVAATTRAIEGRLRAILELTGDGLDLGALRSRTAAFRAATERLQIALLHIAQAESPNYEEGLELGNRALRRLNRLLLPILRHPGDPYAATAPANPGTALLPGLDAVLAYTSLPESRGADESARLRATAIRERNRLLDALNAGSATIDEALTALRPLGFG
jgi:hypothetical protein